MIINSEIVCGSSTNRLFSECVLALCPSETYRKLISRGSDVEYDLMQLPYGQRVQNNWYYIAKATKEYISIGTNSAGELMQVTPTTIKIVQPIPASFLHPYGLTFRAPTSKKYSGITVVGTADGKPFASNDLSKPNVGNLPCTIYTDKGTVDFEGAPKVRQLDRTKTTEIRKFLNDVVALIDAYLIIGAYPDIEHFAANMIPYLSNEKETIISSYSYLTARSVRFLCAAKTPERVVELVSAHSGSCIDYRSRPKNDKQRYGLSTFKTHIQLFLRNPNIIYRVMGGVEYV